ncbi:MAG: hypothetical protein US49_C0008G0020 [candidate division TM6 bacterium GW2011_GWF2_37_49]|nr:MAG: hypothetical protein US49_C0008G0020 [candidate division TM6 bacterium GW2011_GWF2_37_49]
MKKLFEILALFLIATTITTKYTNAMETSTKDLQQSDRTTSKTVLVQKNIDCLKIKKYIVAQKQMFIAKGCFWQTIPSTLEAIFKILESNIPLNWALHTNNPLQVISATNCLFLWLKDIAHKDLCSIYLLLAYIYKHLNINPETHISTKSHEWTLLHAAIKYKYTDILNMFLCWGMDPNTTINDNPLIYTAACYFDINIIEILTNFNVSYKCPILALFVDWKLDKNMQQKGNSLLHAAVEYEPKQFSRKDTVEKLLALGMNPNIKNNANETPLDIAIRNNDTATAQLLLEHGAIAH